VAKTLPTGFQAQLEGVACRPVYAYELELAAGTLRYSNQAFTWDSNSYTALVVNQSNIIEEMGTRVPEVVVTFSNVTNTLRSHVVPDDLITGRRLVIRLLLRDSSDTLLAGSLTLHRGLMERPRLMSEDRLEVRSIGLARGSTGIIPGRSTNTLCGVQGFANNGAFDGAGDCPYVSNTTVTAAGGPSTIISVNDASEFGDEIDRVPEDAAPPDRTNMKIFVGSNTGLNLQSVSGSNLTIAETIEWDEFDAVGFEKCDRFLEACVARKISENYQGFRGVDLVDKDEATGASGPSSVSGKANEYGTT